MDVTVVGKVLATLPDGDDHPYRSGPWQPVHTEYNAVDLDIVGDLPDDLEGVYLRNSENPIHSPLKQYHPFDGDGMVHMVAFSNGSAEYRNRFVRTDGMAAEEASGHALWAGIAENPKLTKVDYGWGARGLMKDASSTDVVVHAGVALTSFWQCGDLYRLDPLTLDDLGKETWGGRFPRDVGVSAHTKVDESNGELLFFNYSTKAPYLNYGVVDASGRLAHYVPIELPGPRLPHDMCFTENYAILNDMPLFWDQEWIEQGVYATRFHPDIPSRLGIIPRRGGSSEMRWFDFLPTYVLHWTNAFEDGDWVVVDGYFQGNPEPKVAPPYGPPDRLFRFLAQDVMQTRLHRWRMNVVTGECKEEDLSDLCTEFGMVNGQYGGRKYRYSYAATNRPGWFLFDGIVKHDSDTGSTERFALPEGVYASETAMAPRRGSKFEDDGYLVTLTIDMNNDTSECLVFDAQSISTGPIARVRLPQRISSGTHSCWAPSSALPNWR